MPINTLTYDPIQKITIKADEDLSAFRFVDFSGALCSGGNKSLGVTDFDWSAGDYASIITLGTATVETAGTVNIGDEVTAAADGKATPVTSNEKINGRAISSCVGAGFIKVILA